MKRIFRFVVFICLASLNVSSLYAQWEATNGPNGGYVNCLVASGTTLFAGTMSGVYFSTNNGTTWATVDSGLPNVYDYVYCLGLASTNLFAGTWRGLYLSTNNGTTWTVVDSGITDPRLSSFAILGANLFAGTPSGVYLSTNNGTSWAAVESGLESAWAMSLTVLGTNLFAGTDGYGVFLSTNNGASWTAVNSGLTNTWVHSFAALGTDLFAGTENGVFLSTNDGLSWTAAGLTNTEVFSLAALPNGAGGTNLFAGATSWDTSVVVIPLANVDSIPVPGTNRIAESDSGGVYLSTNNGTSWTAVDSGLTSTYIWSLAVLGTNLFAGTAAGSVWRRPLSEMVTGVQEQQKNPPTHFSLQQNYPNPFNPSTTISYQLPINCFMTLKVYDVLGREIETLVSERQNAGDHSVTFNATNLPSGVYFYRLRAGDFSETKKLVLVK